MNLRTSFTIICLFTLIMTANAQVVINEILYNTYYPNSGGSFTELKGTAGTSLSGYWLVGIDGTTGAYDSVALTGTIPTSGYFVIAKDSTVANRNQVSAVVAWHQAGGSQGGAGDNVVLKQGTTIIDAVGYGNFIGPDSNAIWAGQPSTNRYCSAPDPYPYVNSSHTDSVHYSIGRFPDGVTTHDNRADFKQILPTPGTANIWAAPTPVARTLTQIRASNAQGVPNDSGMYIITHGTVCCPSKVLNASYDFANLYIQDRQLAGVNIYGLASGYFAFGDSVTVQGYVIQYRGLTEITGNLSSNPRQTFLVVTNHGRPRNPVPEPIDVTTNDLATNGEQYEGMLIRATNAQLVSIAAGVWPPTATGYSNVNINDGSGTTTMYSNKGAVWTGWTTYPAIGSRVPTILGIGCQYKSSAPYTSGYEFVPRTPADFITTGVNEPTFAPVVNEFKLVSAYPNPFNHTTKIHYTIPTGESANLFVFDINGRQVATIGRNIQSGNRLAFWNGRNDAGQAVSGGMYFIRLTGKTNSATLKAIYLP